MKKIFSLGIASAVLAMTAMSASAAVSVRTDDAVETGKTIKVDFVTDVDIPAYTAPGFKVTVSGAEYVAGSETGGMYSNETGKFGFMLMSAAKAGDVLGSITYTVTAKDGEAVTISVSDVQEFGGDTNVAPLQVTVKPATTSDSSDSGSSETPSGSDSGSSSETPSGSDSGSGSGTDNPPMGVALAVFPAIVAGAAVVVAKKRK